MIDTTFNFPFLKVLILQPHYEFLLVKHLKKNRVKLNRKFLFLLFYLFLQINMGNDIGLNLDLDHIQATFWNLDILICIFF